MSRPHLEWLSQEDLGRGVAASGRGRHPVLCWFRHDAWLVTRPEDARQASALMALQRHRGISAALFASSDAERLLMPRCTVASCRDFGGRHWHDGTIPRYFPRSKHED